MRSPAAHVVQPVGQNSVGTKPVLSNMVSFYCQFLQLAICRRSGIGAGGLWGSERKELIIAGNIIFWRDLQFSAIAMDGDESTQHESAFTL